jgi:hypothetical protein
LLVVPFVWIWIANGSVWFRWAWIVWLMPI